ncbi:hypothetical protein AN958_06435, partial [Leucoagaricus sp. SymC.cos]
GTIEPASDPFSVPSPEAEPPITPSPSPQDLITDPNPLHALIASVPAQTLHAYTLAHLIPASQPLSPLSFPHIPLPSEPPSPRTLTALTNFFANLVPPPRLHCVRCHKSYFEVENTDRSCLVPHDDESAEVERVGATGRSKGIGTEYETLWGCCGKTVEGDGDMGPPDGWCYEGKHTTDLKRARFRADSTPYDDKLTSCERLRCHEPPSSSPHSTRGGAKKRRRALIEEVDNEDARSSADGSTASGGSSGHMAVDDSTSTRKPKRARHSKSTSISSKADQEKLSKKDDVTMMDVDPTEPSSQAQAQVPVTPKSPPRARKPRKSGGRVTTPKLKAKSPLTSSFTPPSLPAEESMQTQSDKEKSQSSLPRAVVEITTPRADSPRLSKPMSHSDLRKSSCLSLAEAFKEGENDLPTNKEKPKPKPRTRRNTVGASTPKTPKSGLKASAAEVTVTRKRTTIPISTRSPKPESSVASLKSTTVTNVKPPSTASTTSTPQKPKKPCGGRGGLVNIAKEDILR